MSSNSYSPLISIIVPTYNREKYLTRCIESVLSNSDSDIELIVNDNASPDGTKEMVEKYLSDNRFHYYRNSENIGGSKNLYKAAIKATGEYILVLTDDDYLLPDCIEKIKTIISLHPDVGFIFGRKITLNDRNGDLSTDRNTMGETDCLIAVNDETRLIKCLSFSDVFTGLVYKRSEIDWPIWENSLDNLYPSVIIAASQLTRSPAYYVANYPIVHTIHNTFYWGEFASNKKVLIVSNFIDYMSAFDSVFNNLPKSPTKQRFRKEWAKEGLNMVRYNVHGFKGFAFKSKHLIYLYYTIAREVSFSFSLSLLWLHYWFENVVKLFLLRLIGIEGYWELDKTLAQATKEFMLAKLTRQKK